MCDGKVWSSDSMKTHPERADSDIETEWEENYGDEDGTEGTQNCP
jgi:hypothetical protein